jgi:hypothetical protein
MQRDELTGKGLIFKEQQDESERLDLMLRILQSHKKYENEKYFSGSLFKRTAGGPSAAYGPTGSLQNQSTST